MGVAGRIESGRQKAVNASMSGMASVISELDQEGKSMSISDMVSGAMGYVSAEDKRTWDAKRAEIEREKQQRAHSGAKAVLTTLSNSMLDYAQMRVDADLKAEQLRQAQARPQRKVTRQTVIEDTETHDRYDAHGREMDF